MWMIGTVIGLGIALAVVALYLLSCIRSLGEEFHHHLPVAA